MTAKQFDRAIANIAKQSNKVKRATVEEMKGEITTIIRTFYIDMASEPPEQPKRPW